MERGTVEFTNFVKGVKYLRSTVQGDWQLQQIHIWLTVAANHPNGITMPDIGEQLGMVQGIVSRNCRSLGKYGHEDKDGRKEVRGHDLIQISPDIWETRKYRVYLSQKGEMVREKLMEILGGNHAEQTATATAA